MALAIIDEHEHMYNGNEGEEKTLVKMFEYEMFKDLTKIWDGAIQPCIGPSNHVLMYHVLYLC